MARILFEGTDEQIEMLKILMQSTDNELPTEQTGYYLDTLWHVEDVTSRYECSDEEAFDVLTIVFDEELITADLFDEIARECKHRGLIAKDEAD